MGILDSGKWSPRLARLTILVRLEFVVRPPLGRGPARRVSGAAGADAPRARPRNRLLGGLDSCLRAVALDHLSGRLEVD